MNQYGNPPQPKKGNAATCWIVGGALGCFGIVAVGVLAGFMFPVAQGVMKKAERATTENTVHNLKNAASAYFIEYRKYPTSQNTGPGSIDTTVESTSDLMTFLKGSDPNKNDRGIIFFQGRAAKPGADGGFSKGYDAGTNTLYDPWGNPYRGIFDNNMDNKIDSPETPGTPIPANILIWSAGPDGDFDTWKDNITTW